MAASPLLIACGCLLFFFSGIFAGFAVCHRRIKFLRNGLNSEKLENEVVTADFLHLKHDHETLVKTHNDMVSELQNEKKRTAEQQQEILVLSKASVASVPVPESSSGSIRNSTPDNQHAPYSKNEIDTLRMHLQGKQREIEELEKYRIYYSKFKELFSRSKEMSNTIASLKKQIVTLKSAGISLDRIGRIATIPVVTASTENLPVFFHRFLETVALEKNSRGGVISDEMGFAIASSSEFADELAGISVLFQQCEKIINRNIAFNTLSKITFENLNRLCLTIVPLVINNQPLYFSALSQGNLNIRFPPELKKEEVLKAS